MYLFHKHLFINPQGGIPPLHLTPPLLRAVSRGPLGSNPGYTACALLMGRAEGESVTNIWCLHVLSK